MKKLKPGLEPSGDEFAELSAAWGTGSGGGWTGVRSVPVVQLRNFVFTIEFHKFHFGL
jgi:hypothetical protein